LALLERFPVTEGEPIMRGSEIVGALRRVSDGEHSVVTAFVPSKLGDNPFLDEDYRRRLMLSGTPRWRQMFLEGEWDVFEGQFFTEFEPVKNGQDWHVTREQPTLGVGDRVWVGIDFGWADPFVALFATEQDGVLWVFDEIYQRRLPPEVQGELVTSRCEGYQTVAVAGPDAWSMLGGQRSPASVWAEKGLAAFKANNNRIGGWRAVRSRFAEPGPTIRISERCTNLIRELKTAETSSTNPEEIRQPASDHALDALRYLIVSCVPQPTPVQRTETIVDRDIARLARMYRWRR
jgi:hypothetical protein